MGKKTEGHTLAIDAIDWDSDDEALMEEARSQGCRTLTLVFAAIAAATVCALVFRLFSLASCRSDWEDYYARQEQAAAAAACAYCERDLGAAGARAASVIARGLPEWRELTYRLATSFEVTVETKVGAYLVLVTEAEPAGWTGGDFPRPPEGVSTPVVKSANMVE